MRPLKVKVSVSLDNDIIPVLKNLADKNDRSFSQYINIVLKNYISELKSGRRKPRL